MNSTQLFYLGLICLACNSAPVQEQEVSGKTHDLSESELPPTGDSMPATYDSLFTTEEERLDEHVQMQLFKTVMKGVKVRELYDFSSLENDRMLETFQNFHKVLDRYKDSSDKRYDNFFLDFFGKLEQHEQLIARPDTPDIRTKLQIARIKSDYQF